MLTRTTHQPQRRATLHGGASPYARTQHASAVWERVITGAPGAAKSGLTHARLLRAMVVRLLGVLCTGSIAALAQLGLLAALTQQHWNPTLADAAALVLGTQVNFGLSYRFTWRDRRPPGWTPAAVARRWSLYQGATAATAMLNLVVFVVAHHLLPVLPLGWAALAGTASAAGANFVLTDRVVFRG